MSARSKRSQTDAPHSSELDEARQLLDLERRRYRELFDLAPVGYLVTDLEGVVLEANLAAREVLRRRADDLSGADITELAAAAARDELRALIGEAALGARWQDEFAFLTPDGGSTLLLVYASGPQPGAPQTIRLALADAVTAAAQSARGSVTGYRTDLPHVLDRLHHGVVTLDAELRVTYANSAAERFLGVPGSLAGEVLPDVWPDAPLRVFVSDVFKPEAPPAEMRAALEAGAIAYDVMALPPDGSGEALLVITDVSSALRRERAEREFVANAAHQLRTPVAAIASSIEVLQGGAKEVPEARDRFLAHLDRQAARLVRLTRALLLLARAQALSEVPALELVPLRPLLSAIARALRPGVGVDVRVECPIDLAALANRDLLDQSIENLAENAAKYTVRGEIILCAEPAADGQVRVVVSDTGPGGNFPADGSFARFYRDPTAHDEGFGLGLAIAAEAIRVLGGELRIESGEGGTRAVAYLPAATVRQP